MKSWERESEERTLLDLCAGPSSPVAAPGPGGCMWGRAPNPGCEALPRFLAGFVHGGGGWTRVSQLPIPGEGGQSGVSWLAAPLTAPGKGRAPRAAPPALRSRGQLPAGAGSPLGQRGCSMGWSSAPLPHPRVLSPAWSWTPVGWGAAQAPARGGGCGQGSREAPGLPCNRAELNMQVTAGEEPAS